jgi:hypothetical protein
MQRTFVLIQSSVNKTNIKCKANTPILAAKHFAEQLFQSYKGKSITFTIRNKDKLYNYKANKKLNSIEVKVAKSQKGGVPDWNLHSLGSDKIYDINALGFSIYRLFYVKAVNTNISNDNNTYWDNFYQHQNNVLNNIAHYDMLAPEQTNQLYNDIMKLYNETINLSTYANSTTIDETLEKNKHIVSSFLAHYAENEAMKRPSGPQ